MGRKRRAGQLLASDMPRLRADLVTQQLDYAARLDSQGEAVVAAQVRAETAAINRDEAALWWVARPMVELAAAAAESLGEWTPHACRPALEGVAWWDGGTGIGLDTPGRTVEQELMGCTWTFDGDGTLAIIPLTWGESGGVVIWEPLRARHGTPSKLRASVWALLGATWILAQSERVGVTYGVRYDRRDPGRPFARPELPGRITTVTLRKSAQGNPQIDGLPRGGLTRQHLVRGHWRNQACGPKRAWRKPAWIAPYVKGPAGTELVIKPAVHIWRR